MNKLILATALSLTGLLAPQANAQSGAMQGLRMHGEAVADLQSREQHAEDVQRQRDDRERYRDGERDGGRRGSDEPPVRSGAQAGFDARVGLPQIRNPEPDTRHYGDRHRDGRWDGRRDDRYDDRRWDGRRDSRHEDRRWDGRWDDRYDRRHDRRDDRRHDRDHRRDDRRYWAQHRYRSPVRYVYPRGYSSWDWRIGYALPSPYYSHHYYIDYRYYRLPPPPRGYQWVRVHDDVLLVALGSGLIRDIIYGLFY